MRRQKAYLYVYKRSHVLMGVELPQGMVVASANFCEKNGVELVELLLVRDLE